MRDFLTAMERLHDHIFRYGISSSSKYVLCFGYLLTFLGFNILLQTTTLDFHLEKKIPHRHSVCLNFFSEINIFCLAGKQLQSCQKILCLISLLEASPQPSPKQWWPLLNVLKSYCKSKMPPNLFLKINNTKEW